MQRTDTPLPTPRELPRFTLNIHSLRRTAKGRQFLRETGRWSEDDYVKWKTDKNSAKERERKTVVGPFLGWDGEGQEVNGRHVYTLLANSRGNWIESPTGLTTQECLWFLMDEARKNDKVNHVVYGGSYDSNMILSDLSLSEIQRLCETGTVWWSNYRISYRQRKSLHIIEYHPEDFEHKKGRWQPKKIGSLILWDSIGFFQTRFVDAITGWTPENIPALDFIGEMKDKRGRFHEVPAEKIRDYCIQECRMLVELMTEFRNQCRHTGYVPKRWDGAGALSARILEKEGVREYLPETPLYPQCQYGYFGGRIENVQTGTYEGPVYGHDIVSAYPYAMTKLPCLKHGKWLNTREHYDGGFGIYHIRYTGKLKDRLHPFPVRKDGRVYFPPKAEGWYWGPEVLAAMRHNPGAIEILDGYVWWQECRHQPFKFVQSLFDHRRRLKRNGHPAEKVFKLGLNGLYGKMVQQVGYRYTKSGDLKKPPFHCLEWGGWVTSYTRATIYALAMKNPDSIIAFETDGVYATEPLTTDGDSSLGSWEVRHFEGITYVQSGVYWLKGKDGNWGAKYRGIDRGTLTRDMVIDAWTENASEVGCSQTRFHGMHMASTNPETFVDWRQWVTGPKQITLTLQGKRRHHCTTCRGMVDTGRLHQTTAVQPGDGVSEPYPLTWTASEWTRRRDEEEESFPEEEA